MAAFDLPLEAFEGVIKVTGEVMHDPAPKEIGGKGLFTREIEEALDAGGIPTAWLRNSRTRHDARFLLWGQATRTILAIPRAENRFISAMRIWISAVWRSASQAVMRTPKV